MDDDFDEDVEAADSVNVLCVMLVRRSVIVIVVY